jgi:hypothetical protein
VFPQTTVWHLLAGWILYPPLGYAVGLICAADRELRSG